MSDDQYDTVYPLLHCDQGFKAWTAIPIRRSTNTMTTATSTARVCPRCGDDIKYPWKHYVLRNGVEVECNSDLDDEQATSKQLAT